MKQNTATSKLIGIALVCLMLGGLLGIDSNPALAEGQSQSISIRVKTATYGDGSILTLDLESDYLPVVVGCENGAAPYESMKVQAVASRTFAMYKIEHPSGADFDVYDDERDQVYNPAITVIDKYRGAVEDTRDIVLKYTGKVICAFFVSGTGDTAEYVTYNEGKSGDDITQTTLGWCTDPPSKNPYNRGCMGQVQANALAPPHGDYNYQQILKYFYGADIEGLPLSAETPWPMFQHDAQHSGRSPFTGPGISENPQVQVFIEGDYFYPVVIDSSGVLYLEARINGKGGVYAFYPNGIQKWYYEIPLGYSSSLMVFTPIIGPNGAIYVSVPTDRAIIAINPDGSLKWETIFTDLTPGSLVIGDNGIIYSLARSTAGISLIALDSTSGNTLWVYDLEYLGSGWSAPAIGSHGTIYFGYKDTLYAINPDGTEKWQREFIPDCQHFDCQPEVLIPSIGDNGTIYVMVREEKDFWALQDAGMLPCLHAINPENPNVEEWPAKCNKFYGSGPLTISSAGNLYLTGGYEWITVLFGFDSQGNDLGNWPITGIGRGGLLIVDKEEIIYGLFGSPYSTLKAFDQNGEEKWALPLSILRWDGHISLGGDGTIYVTGGQKVYAIGLPDTTPPTVSSVSPEDGATDVAVDAAITATFSEPMDSPTLTTESFTLAGSAVSGNVTYDSNTYTATFTPDANLDYDHEYTATLSTDITDEAGNPLVEAYTWSFTTEPAPGDTAPPAILTNLEVSGATASSITLTWTAPGDDGNTGRASYYDLRCSTSPITEANWDSATGVPIPAGHPLPAGYTETMGFSGLLPGTTYYFALKTADEARNWSGLSNVVSGTTKEELAARIEVDKTSIKSGERIPFNGSGSTGQIVSYEWNFDDGTKVRGSGKPGVEAHRFRGTMNESKTYNVTLMVEDDKGATGADTVQVVVESLEKTAPVEGLGYTAGMTVSYNWVKVDGNGQDIYIISKITAYAALFRGGCEVDIHDGDTGVSMWRDVFISRDWVQKRTWLSPFEPSKPWPMGISCPVTALTFPEDAVEPVEVFEGIEVRGNDDMSIAVLGLTAGITLKPSLIFDETKTKFYPDAPVEQLGPAAKVYFDLLVSFVRSPVELRVYDSQENVTGLVSGEIKERVLNSDYDGETNTVVILCPSDSYRYEVTGTGEGAYGLTVCSVVEDGESTTFTAIDIPTAPGAVHQYTIDWDALSQGEKGVTVQVDSDGDGEFEDTFTSDDELTGGEFILQTATTVDFDPDTLNLKSKGKYVTVYIELPPDYDVGQIDVSSVMLNEVVPALTKPTEVGDYDGDGIPDLMVKFDRAAVQEILQVGEQVEVTITGKAAGVTFQGADTIRVLDK